MKTFNYTINGVQYQVEVVSIKGNIADVRVNGSSYEVELEKSYDIDQEAWAAQAAMPKATPVAKPAAAPAPAPKAEEAPAPAAPAAASASAGAGAPLKSPLPGVIVKIATKVGDTVKKGQKIMVLEAMKMENDIKADRDGVVTSILVTPNSSVQEGDTLLTIE